MHQTRNSSAVFANYPKGWIVPLVRPIPASEATCLDTSGFVSVSLPSVSTLHCHTHSIAYLKQCKLNTKSLNTVCECVCEGTHQVPSRWWARSLQTARCSPDCEGAAATWQRRKLPEDKEKDQEPNTSTERQRSVRFSWPITSAGVFVCLFGSL